MWNRLSLVGKGVLGVVVVGGVALAVGLGRATAADGPADVFSLFDKGVASIVANTSCGVDDPAAFEAFTQEFSKVASVVADELQRMNPERSRSEIDMVVGFRMAQLEMKTTSQVKKDGCNAPDVRASRALFNIGRRLAFIEGERREYNH